MQIDKSIITQAEQTDYGLGSRYCGTAWAFFALIAASPTIITGNPLDDALGTITIGVLLIMSAIVIGVERQDMMIRIGDQWLRRTNCKPNGLILNPG